MNQICVAWLPLLGTCKDVFNPKDPIGASIVRQMRQKDGRAPLASRQGQPKGPQTVEETGEGVSDLQ